MGITKILKTLEYKKIKLRKLYLIMTQDIKFLENKHQEKSIRVTLKLKFLNFQMEIFYQELYVETEGEQNIHMTKNNVFAYKLMENYLKWAKSLPLSLNFKLGKQ